MKKILIPAVLSIMITSIISAMMLFLSAEILEKYGYGVFLVTPLMCGAISSVLYNIAEKRKIKESLFVSLLSGFISLLGFFTFGYEGGICLLMAAPIMLPCFALGGLLGHGIFQLIRDTIKGQTPFLLMLGLLPILLGLESRLPVTDHIRQVQTRIFIEGDIGDVWQEVIAFNTIPEPTEWLFKMGIAYPIDATIEGHGVGAIRYCNFSTGSFVEPITQWNENKLLAFDVTAQPLPMTEMSPYVNIHPPHLDWAFVSHKGQFRLNQLADGKVELIGTTWFHTEIGPEFYWGNICEELIHIIHLRVLNHIKQSVETTD